MRGLCFSGGGIKVASHIGALKALEEKNEGLFDYDQNDSRETCAK